MGRFFEESLHIAAPGVPVRTGSEYQAVRSANCFQDSVNMWLAREIEGLDLDTVQQGLFGNRQDFAGVAGRSSKRAIDDQNAFHCRIL